MYFPSKLWPREGAKDVEKMQVLSLNSRMLQEGSPTPLRPSGNRSRWDDKKIDMVLVFVTSHHDSTVHLPSTWPFLCHHLSRLCRAKMSSHEAEVGDIGSEKTLGP